MAAANKFPQVDAMSKPTGPTGILRSSRRGKPAGGKAPASKSGLSCSPAKSGMSGKRY